MPQMDDLPPRHLRGRVVCETCGFNQPAGWEEAFTAAPPAILAKLLREHFHGTGHIVTPVLEKEVPNEMPIGYAANQLKALIVVELALARDDLALNAFLHVPELEIDGPVSIT